jgi:hypothetical protein
VLTQEQAASAGRSRFGACLDSYTFRLNGLGPLPPVDLGADYLGNGRWSVVSIFVDMGQRWFSAILDERSGTWIAINDPGQCAR